MILVVAPFPCEENEKDGMIQRVAAIDALMKNAKRTYVDVSFRRHISGDQEKIGLARVHRLNFFIHFFLLCRLVRKAKLVYVHSAYNALKILPFFPKNKVIFDAHGVVPEELISEGHPLASRIISLAERTAIHRSLILVTVTQRMSTHFTKKYGRQNSCDLVYPILPHFDLSASSRETTMKANRTLGSVIYAGGLQSWQNVNKMIAASAQRPNFSYTFLTGGDVKMLREKLNSAQLPRAACESASPQTVKDHYITHEYGYILREPILVNAVACPTKLIEYLYWGVIPIVITPEIGDFNEHTLRSVSLQNFIADLLPAAEEAAGIREYNRATVAALIADSSRAERILRSLLLEAVT